MPNLSLNQHTQARWLLKLFIVCVIIMGVSAGVQTFSNAYNPLQVQSALAQGGSGADPTDKPTSIDFYPDPLADGALAFSLRDPWDHTDLTYFFHNCPSRLDCVQARDAVRTGFDVWVNISPLTFTEVNSASDADIEVQWVDSNTDPEGELGTVGGVLAYAYFPRFGGDLFIDDVEPWTLFDGGEFDMVITAIHEIGHSIGLGHSEFQTAIMYPYSGYASEIGSDDLAAIQALYGLPTGTTPTTTDPGTSDTPRNVPDNEATTTVEGSITNTSSYEVWDLTVDAGETVTITMIATSDDLDPYVGILTSNQSEVLVENDDFGDGHDAQVTYTFAEAGVYTVVATRYGFEDGTTSGGYTLTFESSNTNQPSGPTDNRPNQEAVTFRITNFSETDLCFIYVSPSTADSWGEDELSEQEVLNNNFYLEWEVEQDSYDIQVWDCFNHKLERYNIPAQRNVDVQIFSDSIEVVPLGTTASAPTPPENIGTWRVTNYADTELCEVFFSESTADEWGPNQVGDEPLLNNTYIEWQLPRGTYDIQVWDCFEHSLEQREINLRGNIEIQVYADRILVVPLQS